MLGAQSNPFQNLDKSMVLQEVRFNLDYYNVIFLGSYFIILKQSHMLKSSSFFFKQARTFNETPINPRKCIHILTKILYVLNQVGGSDLIRKCVYFYLLVFFR